MGRRSGPAADFSPAAPESTPTHLLREGWAGAEVSPPKQGETTRDRQAAFSPMRKQRRTLKKNKSNYQKPGNVKWPVPKSSLFWGEPPFFLEIQPLAAKDPDLHPPPGGVTNQPCGCDYSFRVKNGSPLAPKMNANV